MKLGSSFPPACKNKVVGMMYVLETQQEGNDPTVQ